ncbi:hypothetical protein HMPREF0083_00561 [Aneurinibacillus aneurinilyticus ATCC 12856]|uniref:DUF3139 domain-containing protein n=2 Tax=Aneurinibacillus aneurinilyticus TaxID=1391 RepID=U1X9Y1_ANEAE|nr:hypothetical protein HMPREF0083_00561 [Aneurinibacillus aneurinilyticus ATCC 12856]
MEEVTKMKKREIIIFLLVIALISTPFIYIKTTLISLENKVHNYLVMEKGIENSNISSIKGLVGKAPLFAVEVVFTDETDVRYLYREIESGEIIQLGPSLKPEGYRYKHMES